MPFAPTYSWDEEKLNQKKQGGFNISGESKSFDSNVPAQDNEKSKSGSGQYTNIQKYIQANQGAAEDMGNKITQDIESTGQAAQNKIQEFGTQKQNVGAYDPSSILSNTGRLSDEQKNQYKEMKKTGGYTGPQDLNQIASYGEASKAAQAAQDKAMAAQSEEGQRELLKTTFQRPSYTQGQNKLDQALLMGSDSARGNLKQTSDKYKTLTDLFSQQAKGVGDSINQAKQTALANQQAMNQQETDAFNSLKSKLDADLQKSNQYIPELQNSILNDISDNILTSENMDRLGLNNNQMVYDLNINDYLNINPNQQTYNDVAQGLTRDRYKDLIDLMGAENTLGITENQPVYSPYNFDQMKLNRDIERRGQEVNQLAGGVDLGSQYFGNMQDFLNSGMGSDEYMNKKLNDALLGGVNIGDVNSEGWKIRKNQGNQIIRDFQDQYMKKLLLDRPQFITDTGGKQIKGVY